MEFRFKLWRDTGVNLTAAACAGLLEQETFEGKGAAYNSRGQASLESNPGLFYTCLGDAIFNQRHALVIPDHLTVAVWCFREAAEAGAYTSRLNLCTF